MITWQYLAYRKPHRPKLHSSADCWKMLTGSKEVVSMSQARGLPSQRPHMKHMLKTTSHLAIRTSQRFVFEYHESGTQFIMPTQCTIFTQHSFFFQQRFHATWCNLYLLNGTFCATSNNIRQLFTGKLLQNDTSKSLFYAASFYAANLLHNWCLTLQSLEIMFLCNVLR